MTNPVYDSSEFYSRSTPSGGSGGSGGAASTVTVLPPTAASINPVSGYTGTLTPGTYTRADIVTLTTGTELIDFSVTGLTGTFDFTQRGTVTAIGIGASVTKVRKTGLSIDDFSFVVNASSSVVVEASSV